MTNETTTVQINPVAKQAPKGKQATKGKTATKAPAVKFYMLQGFRPVSGGDLFAHTHAVLTLLGMYKGAHVAGSTLPKLLGDTAIKHHIRVTGFLGQDKDGYYLNEGGKQIFPAREMSPESIDCFTQILTTGTHKKDSHKTYANPIGIKAL